MAEVNDVKPEDLEELKTSSPCKFKDTAARDNAIKKGLGYVIKEFCDYFTSSSIKYAYGYGKELARWVERVWRKETANFTSGFSPTCGAGMHPMSSKFPWRWSKLKRIWTERKDTRPKGYRVLTEAQTNIPRYYLAFANPTAFAIVLARVIMKNSNELTKEVVTKHKLGLDPENVSDRFLYGAGRWYTTNPKVATDYGKAAQKFSTSLTDSLPDNYDDLVKFLNK